MIMSQATGETLRALQDDSCVQCTDSPNSASGWGEFRNRGYWCGCTWQPCKSFIANNCMRWGWRQDDRCTYSCAMLHNKIDVNCCLKTEAPTTMSPTTPQPTFAPTASQSSNPTSTPKPTLAPTSEIPPPCTACTDVATEWMINNNFPCTLESRIEDKCNLSGWWRNEKFCAASCSKIGLGYDGDNCCFVPDGWQKPAEIDLAYNLIWTDFNCQKESPFPWIHVESICPHIQPGDVIPSAYERFQMVRTNTARLFPDEFKAYQYSNNFNWHTNTIGCGEPQPAPYSVHRFAQEHSRWFALSMFDGSCERPGEHATCNDDCYIFGGKCDLNGCSGGSCNLRDRTSAFRSDIEVVAGQFRSESICGVLEGCLADGHCGFFFNPGRKFFSLGNKQGTTKLVLNGQGEGRQDPLVKDWDIPTASHFDRKARTIKTTVGNSEEAMMFQAVYYNPEMPVKHAYLLYKGLRHDMRLVFGSNTRGLFEFNAGALPYSCEAYYFYFVREDDTTVRLPEDPRYMFGTADINGCPENHYYDVTGNRAFVANGGPNSPGLQICEGCASAVYIDHEVPEYYAPFY